MSRLPEIANPQRPAYSIDLSDAEWKVLEPLLLQPKGSDRPRTVDLREILNAIFYLQRTGCQWEMLPHDLPLHGTVFKYFRKWRRKGIWRDIHDTLRHNLRREMGRESYSSVAIADSQSVKTTEKKGAVYGFDSGKKIKGRKRNIVVESQGLIIGVLVTEANASEQLGAVVVPHEEIDKLSRLEVIWVDQGYSGPNFKRAVQQVCGEKARVEVIERESKEFEVLSRLKHLAVYLDMNLFWGAYGDGVCNVNVTQLLEFHHSHGKLATMTAVRPASRFGKLVIEDNLVSYFQEKPQTSEGWINGGYFVLHRKVLNLIQDDNTIFEAEPLKTLAIQGELAVYSGFWQCVDTYRELELLNKLYKSSKALWKVW